MPRLFKRTAVTLSLALLALAAFPAATGADHAWGTYHWARQSNPFTLQLGDNLTSTWDPYLATTAAATYPGWGESVVLDTTIVAGRTRPKQCRPTSGRVEVCNAKYGNTGWLGVAQIWVSGGHITQGTAKLNDTYFNTARYNTPAWRNLVMCQEVAHTFGLDHQDENFDNWNLGTCQDYTSDPDGGDVDADGNVEPTNEYPNDHDYEQLEIIYGHLDDTTTVASSTAGNGQRGATMSDWGQLIRTSGDGRASLFVLHLGRGQQVFTFVIWAQ